MTRQTKLASVRTPLAGGLGLVLLRACLAGSAAAGEDPVATASAAGTALRFQIRVEAERWVLTLQRPDGTVQSREFAAGTAPSLEIAGPAGDRFADGLYRYELRGAPRVDPQTRAVLAAARESGDESVAARLREEGKLPRQDLVLAGHFWVRDGRIVLPSDAEEPASSTGASDGDKPPEPGPVPEDQVIMDDLIVNGSLCVGMDCVNGENFGFDTIRLKENNLRIGFDDTSTGTFPANDWELTANDSSNGGANRFSITDITNGRVPFTVDANSPSNSLYVDSTGRIGFQTSTPAVDLHVATGDTPELRLEQNGSSGFTPQTWDVAGNETNFFVRDATGGSRLPFRIRPGAPTSSLDISANGNIAIGTSGTPLAQLHVFQSDGTAKILVQDAGTTVDPSRDLLHLKNNGPVSLRLENCDPADPGDTGSACNTTVAWVIRLGSAGFSVTKEGSGGSQLLLRDDGRVELGPGSGAVFTLDTNGDLDIAGALSQSSDARLKEAIAAIDGADLLARLAELPILAWSFKADGAGVRHLGPMAQDFYRLFGLGKDERHIAPLDASGIALAAIQELHRQVRDKDAALEELRRQNARLEARLAALESKLAAQPASTGRAPGSP
jgi:hypothetical protein